MGLLCPVVHFFQNEADAATVPVPVQMLLMSQQVRCVFFGWGSVLTCAVRQNKIGSQGGKSVWGGGVIKLIEPISSAAAGGLQQEKIFL